MSVLQGASIRQHMIHTKHNYLGQVVKIWARAGETLQLAEVEIYGMYCGNCGN